MKPILCIFIIILLASCGYDRFGTLEKDDFSERYKMPNSGLVSLYESYIDRPKVLLQNSVFEGYVTATDDNGNFFRSFIIEDATGAVEICAGFYDLNNHYPIGRRIIIHAYGLYVGKYNGVMQLGVAIYPYSAYKVEEFGTPNILNEYVTRDTLFKTIKPLNREIEQLREKHCGRVVRIENLKAEEINVSWDNGSDTYNTTGTVAFTDSNGNRIVVATSAYADFAATKVPEKTVTLTGILMFGKFSGNQKCFVLKLRSLDDVE